MDKEKRDERFDKINQKMEELTKEVYETTETMKKKEDAAEEKITESIEVAKEKANELKESVKSYADNISLKGYEGINKIKDSLDDLKLKLADKKDEYDKERFAKSIDKKLDYVDSCIELSLYLQAEAKLAFLEALQDSAEYEEKYGD